MCVAAAILGAAAIGAAGSAFAGSEAAGATTQAASTAANTQTQALQQEAALSAPYRALGQSAIPTYQALLGIGGSGANISGAPSGGARIGGVSGTTGIGGISGALSQMPGYQFAQQQGTQNTEAALNAEGLGLSGNAATALSGFNTGLAQQNYQQYLGDVAGAVNSGQAAAAGQAANVAGTANNLSNIAVNQGNNIAGIEANTTAGITNALGGAVNNALTYQTLQSLTNPNYGAPSGWSTGGQSGDLNYQQQVAAGF